MMLIRCIALLLMFFLSAAVAADTCDYCVCKSKDTENSCTQCCAAKMRDHKSTVELQLQVSTDGKSIVDQNGAEIARFAAGMRLQPVISQGISQKLQGCMRCWNECLIYEGERCIKTIRTCEWDFNCTQSQAGATAIKVSDTTPKNTVEKSTQTPNIIERELTPNTGDYMKTPCYKSERYCTEWLPDKKCKLWDTKQVPC